MKKLILGFSCSLLFSFCSCKKEYQCLSCDSTEEQTTVEAKNKEEALKKCKDKNCSQAFESLYK